MGNAFLIGVLIGGLQVYFLGLSTRLGMALFVGGNIIGALLGQLFVHWII
jgi:hypothetical protein